MTLQLSDHQAQTLSACGLCSRPLEWGAVKAALQSGDVNPPDLYCAGCGDAKRRGKVSPARAMAAALRILGRIEAAGLTEHYKGVAAASGYPPRKRSA